MEYLIILIVLLIVIDDIIHAINKDFCFGKPTVCRIPVRAMLSFTYIIMGCGGFVNISERQFHNLF